MQLTPHQKLALYKIVKDLREEKRPQVSLGGFAGTGKSTLLKYLVKFFPTFAIAAYTGKAANVLRKKGIQSATTIHSRIYKPYFDENGAVYFDLTDDPSCDGFLIDESSMISREIYDDLCSFGLPMVYVGDHGQLEPIGTDFNLMKKPDYKLEEIHRNAGDIAKFAEHVRNGYPSRTFKCSDDSVRFLSQKELTDDMLTSVDQIICAYNKTRVAINARVREALGYTGILNVGEKIMCLRNNRRQGLFNGMQGIVRNLYTYKNKKCMDFEFDDFLIEGIRYDEKQFGQESYDIKMGQDTPNPFDYAACITAHKSQGDEFDSVLVLEQKCAKWDHKRWIYTAASRAKSNLYLKCHV